MSTTSLPSERAAVLAAIDPDANSTGELLSGAIDMASWGRIMAIVMVGDIASTGKVDAVFKESDASAGTYAAISGKSITQLTEAGTDSNKQVVINLRADEMTQGKRYIKLSMTGTTAGADSAGVVLGFDPRHAPASDYDATTVDEIVK